MVAPAGWPVALPAWAEVASVALGDSVAPGADLAGEPAGSDLVAVQDDSAGRMDVPAERHLDATLAAAKLGDFPGVAVQAGPVPQGAS